jgi:endonuclease G
MWGERAMRKRVINQPGECFGKYTNYRACQECVLKDRCRAEVLKDSVLRTEDERRGSMKKILSILVLLGVVAMGYAETNEIKTEFTMEDMGWATNFSAYTYSNLVISGSSTGIVNWSSMTNYLPSPRGDWSRGTAYAGQPVSSNSLTILTNDSYLVGYSEEDGCPLWVCYTLNATTEDAPTRPSTSFKTDKRTTAQIKTGDYTNTGYDRGHMAPSYGMGLSHGADAQLQTFLMSNVIPQTPELNRGIWKKLEQTAANDWAQEREKIWVITGPVFIETNRVNGIRVPAGSFKVLIDETRYVEVQAFLMPQHPVEDATLGLYLTSVDEIERQTGLDLLPELPDDAEDEIEKGTW